MVLVLKWRSCAVSRPAMINRRTVLMGFYRQNRGQATYPALTIAGSDPSGGAGIQADLKTFHQLGAYGMSAVTLVTVQNTMRVSRVEPLEPALVAEQIRAVLEDLPPLAAKTGALGTAPVIQAVVEALAG